ncbi:MAG: hypothetical protein QM704_06520 [Anaeromyxobacteraceae bacterium]
MNDRRVESVYRALKGAFVFVPIAAGADKFLNLLADWEAYVSPLARSLLPVSPAAFMRIVGLVEIAAGVLVLVRPRLGGRVVAAWLVLVAVNLVLGLHLDVAVRDLVMALAAWGVARLAEVHETAAAPLQARPSGAPAGA